MPRDWSDGELVRRCRGGDRLGWEEFFRRFSPTVYGTVRRVLFRKGLGERQDLAEDITQEVFLEFVEKSRLSQLQDPMQLKRFVAALAACRTVDAARPFLRRGRYHRPPHDIGVDAEDPSPGPAEEALRGEVREIIRSEIDSLTEKESTVMKLWAQEGLTHREIADLLGFAPDTVSTVVRRCRDKIAQALREGGFEMRDL